MSRKYDKSGFEHLLRDLSAYYGPVENIFSGRTFFESAVLIVLLQNSSYTNAISALKKMKDSGLDTPYGISVCDRTKLSQIIRFAGCQVKKSETILLFASSLICRKNGVCELYFSDREKAVEFLTGIPGIGKETADSIALYVLDKPYFALNSYSKRFLARTGFLNPCTPREVVSFEKLINDDFIDDIEFMKSSRMAIEAHSKEYCKTIPRCKFCFIREKCQKLFCD